MEGLTAMYYEGRQLETILKLGGRDGEMVVLKKLIMIKNGG